MLYQMGSKDWVDIKFMSCKEETFVLRGEPLVMDTDQDATKTYTLKSPYQTVSANHFYPTIMDARVKICGGWGLYSTIESLHCACGPFMLHECGQYLAPYIKI